jgi:hypothetical protein
MLTAAITERQFVTDQRDRSYRTWEVKVLSKIFASSIQFEDAGKAQTFMDQVDDLSLELPEEKKLRAEYVRPIDDTGAYERAVLAFGGVPFDPSTLDTGSPQAVAQASGWQWIDEDGPEGFY